MSWVMAGIAAAGAVMGNVSANKARNAQKDAAKAGMESQERMFEKSLELQQPYRQAGYDALEQLQGFNDPTQRGQMLGDYYASPEYLAQQNQAEQLTLQNRAVQGGLRSGSTYSNLQTIAPQLGQNYLSNRYNQLTGLANLGMGAASQGASSANNLGVNQALGFQQIGTAQANAALAQGNQANQLFGTLGGIYKNSQKNNLGG